MCSSYSGGHYLHDYIIRSSNYNMHPSVWSPSDVVWSSSSVIIILPFAVKGTFPAVEFDMNTKYVTVHSKYLKRSGLVQIEDKLDHQGSMVLLRLCILDLTQRLPDLVISSSCHWPLPPEDRGYVVITHTNIE